MLFHRPALHHRSGVRILLQCAAVSSADGAGRVPTGVAQKSHPCGHPSIPFQRRQCAAVSSATRHATHQVVGSAPMRIALVLVRSFLMGNAVPTHPTTLKPHAGGMDATACIVHGTPSANQGQCNPYASMPPALRGERLHALYEIMHIFCAVSPPARGRPLGGSRRGRYLSCGLVCARAHGHCFG